MRGIRRALEMFPTTRRAVSFSQNEDHD